MSDIENKVNRHNVVAKASLAFTPMKTANRGMETPKGKARPSVTNSTPGTPQTPGTVSARDAARMSKLQNTADRIKAVGELKNKWAVQKQEKLQHHRQSKAAEHARQRELSKVIMDQRLNNAKKQKEHEKSKKDKAASEMADSLAARTQLAKDLAEEEKEKRRRSNELKESIFRFQQQKAAELQAKKDDDQAKELSIRRLDHLEVREAKKRWAASRRESMVQRGKVANKQRAVQKQLEKQDEEDERSLMSSRSEGQQDVAAHKAAIINNRRKSLAGRLNVWRKHKEMEKQQTEESLNESVLESDIRREDWMDVQQYQKECSDKSRQSLAGRLDKWRTDRKTEADLAQEKKDKETLEAELSKQEADDVSNYLAAQKQCRRQSLAFRLVEAKKGKAWDEGRIAAQQVIKEEDERIKEQDRTCVKEYKNMMEHTRRQSMAYRNLKKSQEKRLEEGEAAVKQMQKAEDFEIDTQNWQDIKEYQANERRAARESLVGRLQEAQRWKELALEEHSMALSAVHEEFQHKREDWLAIKEASQDEKASKRRKSTAFRLKSWKEQRVQDEKKQLLNKVLEEEESNFREMERQDLEAAKKAMASEEAERYIGNMVF